MLSIWMKESYLIWKRHQKIQKALFYLHCWRMSTNTMMKPKVEKSSMHHMDFNFMKMVYQFTGKILVKKSIGLKLSKPHKVNKLNYKLIRKFYVYRIFCIKKLMITGQFKVQVTFPSLQTINNIIYKKFLSSMERVLNCLNKKINKKRVKHWKSN